MDSKSARVVSMSIRPKLILYPRNRLSEECRRFFRERPAFLVQLGTKRPKGAPSVCKHIPVLKRILDTRLKAFLRGTRLVPLFAQRPKFQQALLNNGLADFIFCLEVVVDVADWDLGRRSDIGEARLPESTSVRQLHSRANQPRSFLQFRSWHCSKYPVSQLTDLIYIYVLVSYCQLFIDVFGYSLIAGCA